MVFMVENKIGKPAPQALNALGCDSSHFIFGGSKMVADLAFVAPRPISVRTNAFCTPPHTL